jgi:hypothetical protein
MPRTSSRTPSPSRNPSRTQFNMLYAVAMRPGIEKKLDNLNKENNRPKPKPKPIRSTIKKKIHFY